jgi:membrane protease subunit HflK
MKLRPKLPHADKVVERLKTFRRRLPRFYVIILILVLVWILSGIYVVAPDEQGVVKSFGKLTRILEPGLHYHLPYPIESVSKPKVTEIQRFEFGFRTVNSGPLPQYKPMADEALILTGDENIIDVWFVVQFRIKDATNFLFNVSDPFKTMRDAAEATMRAVMGENKIDTAMTTGRLNIQNDAQKALQKILDSYESGLQIIAFQLQAVQPPEQVREAFKDVTSAREEKNKFINEAQSYTSDILHRAKGLAVQIELEAEGYKEQKIKQAQGDADRFLALLKEYRNAKKVTRKRLYLETMEEILGPARKLVVDLDKQGVLQLLPLQELIPQVSEAPKEKQDSR